jgi:hypothetical protein
LTVGQLYDYISSGQRVSRFLADPVLFIFFPPTFFKTILAGLQVAHLALLHSQADPSQSPKSHFLPTHRRINVIKKVTLTDINFR